MPDGTLTIICILERMRSRRTRRLLYAGLGLGVLVALVVVLPNLPAVRDVLLARVARSVLESSGAELRGRLLLVDLVGGRLRLADVTYGMPGAAPIFTARSLSLQVAPLTLFSERPRIVIVVAEGARIDLTAPRPASKEPASKRPLDLPLTLEYLAANDLTVVHPRARLENAKVGASYVAGQAVLALTDGRLVTSLGGKERSALVAITRLEMLPEGAISIQGLTAKGAGLDLSLSAAGSLQPGVSLEGNAELRLSLAELEPELRARGQLHALVTVTGTLAEPQAEISLEGESLARDATELASLSARLHASRAAVVVRTFRARPANGGELTAEGSYAVSGGAAQGTVGLASVPAALLKPFLDARTLALLRAPRATLDGNLAFALPQGWGKSLEATTSMALEEEGRTLAELTGKASSDGARLTAVLEGELLPGSPGRRSISATLEAATDLRQAADGRLVRSRVEVAAPDVVAALGELHALWPSLVPAPSSLGGVAGALDATVDLSGPLRSPSAVVVGEWRPDARSSVRIAAEGEPLARKGRVRLDLADLLLAPLRADFAGQVSGTAQLAGSARAFSVSADLRGAGLLAKGEAAAEGDVTASLRARVAGSDVALERLSVRDARRSLLARGSLDARRPWDRADLDVVTTGLSEGLHELQAHLVARQGMLTADAPSLTGYGTSGSLSLRAPMGALRPWLGFLPEGLPAGRLELNAAFPRLDSRDVREALGLPRGEESASASVRAALEVDLARPLRSSGELVLEGLRIESPAASARAPEAVRLAIGDGVVRLLPARLVGEGTELALSGSASLGESRAELVRAFTLDVNGGVQASLLNAFLRGGIGEGRLELDAKLTGTPKAPSGTVRVEGPEATFFWPTPYASRIQAPRLVVELAGGAATLREGEALLNGGRVTLAGGRDAAGNLELSAGLAGVRYVLAYGVRAELGGKLRLWWPVEGSRLLSGALSFDRGLLDRDVDLDREILTRFFAPPESQGSEASVLDTIQARLTVTTGTGVRIRNNLADLRAVWSALEVTGTLREPVIRGRIDVEQGGLLYAYGQTFRIESAALIYTGDPSVDPKIDAVTTSSLQDPTLARGEGAAAALAGAQQGLSENDQVSTGEALVRGIGGYYGERVAQRLSQALGFARVSLRPILLFGETDPSAKLTVSRDLSRHVAFAFSLDLTNAQQKTYLVDVHGLRPLPTMTAQVFTNDAGNYGGTLQASLRLGGSRRKDEDLPLLQRVVVTPPEGVSKRKLLEAIGLSRGDPAPSSAAFDSEVEIERALRAAGYPDARVTTALVPSARKGRVDLAVSIAPGTRTRFAFEGDEPPKATRASITALYRGDFYQAQSLEEMTRRAVRVFRALGYLRPAVSVSVTPPPNRSEARLVTVRSEAGARVALEPPVFAGVDEEEARILAARFTGPVERAELAAGEPDADRRLLASLTALGYPEARLASRELEGPRLTVALEPGRRSAVASVGIEGLSEADASRLRPAIPLAPGDTLRSDLVARGTLAITRDLESRGFAEARVRAEVGPASPAPVPPLRVSYVVEPGLSYRVAAVRFEGVRSASRSLLKRVAAIRDGEPYRREEVDAARGRLFDVGLFSAVREETVKAEDGRADVVFRVEEKPRFSLAWGVRFENGPGTSAVVDVVDSDLFGRAITAGLRGLYAPHDKGARLFTGARDLLGSGIGLEMYAEGRREDFEDRDGNPIRTDVAQVTLQASRSFGARTTAHLYARYRRSKTVITDPLFGEFETLVKFPYLGAQLLYDSREDPAAGSRGLFASLDLEGSGSLLGSDFAYARVYGQVNVYRPLFRLGRVPLSWAQSLRAGYARAFAGQDLLPGIGPGVRFFAGGEYSVRGYELNSLGPLDVPGDPTSALGGAAILVVNEELRFPIYSRVSGLVFFDAGNVWSASGDFGSRLAKSVGLGLRATTPVGLIRLDAARPLDRREGDKALKIYVGFGQAF